MSVGNIYTDSITENSTFNDILTIQYNASSSITENVSILDSLLFVPWINNSLQVIPWINNSGIVIPWYDFSIYAYATLGYFYSITEDSTLADSSVKYATFNSLISEPTTLLDISTVQAKFNSFVNENMVLFEQLIGYGWFKIVDDQTITWNNINNSQSTTWTNIGDDQNPNWVTINNGQP